MFSIMTAVSKRDNNETLYKFLNTTVDNVTKPVELKDRNELDARVEKMLNEEGYSKDDFIIVTLTNYKIDAKDYGSGD